LTEILELKTIILPSDGGKAPYLRMGFGNYIILDFKYQVDPQIRQECFERDFEELWRKGRREHGMDESDTPKIIWVSTAELESKLENEKVNLRS
jgi:hypothetical protein